MEKFSVKSPAMEKFKNKDLKNMLVRRKSDSGAIVPSQPNLIDSDEDVENPIDYNEEKYYGWNSEGQVPAPVQLKRPTRQSIRRPGDKLHLAVWNDDPAKVQKLVLRQGNYF